MESKGNSNGSNGCPFTGGAKSTRHSNRDWWPNSLDLNMLRANSSLSDPMGEDFNYAEEFRKLDLDAVIKGDTVREVLHYVQYSAEELASRMRKDVERAVRAGKLSVDEARQLQSFYESGLEGYTYLEEPQG